MRLLVVLGLGLAIAAPAYADPIARGGDFERPFGMNGESFGSPINPSTRDENGNRLVVNGRLEIEGTLSGGLMDGYSTGGGSSAQAIGNQLNVVTNGSYNTVIVDSTQINNGDISAEVNGDN